MAYDTFTVALNAASFPFTSDMLQRTVLIPGIDQPPKAGKLVTGTDEGSNKELAQNYYCQNVMPMDEGIYSVGYSQLFGGILGATDFDQVMTLRDANENNFLFAPARGKNYIYTANRGSWLSTNPFGAWAGSIVSRSYVNGRTFVHYEGYDSFEYNSTTGQFLSAGYTGITPSAINCIGGSNNYNIAVTGIQVNWSSLINPTDFTASVQTGAGFAIPQDMKGVGRAVIPISGGFLIYTNKNVVAALYTNNARSPFVFKEVSNAGGITSPEQISLEASLGYHYAWTTNGLQKITASSAENLESGVTDFFAGRIWEEFDIPSLTLTMRRISSAFKVKVTFVSGRYLVLSYGLPVTPQLYTHALVLDVTLKRWGKLRIDHVDCFTYPYPNLIGQVTESPPKQSIAFITKDGTVSLLVMDYRDRADQGVLLLGKYQLVRQKMATFQKVEVEGLVIGHTPNIYLILSVDGSKNLAPNKLSLLSASDNMVTLGAPAPGLASYAAPRTGKNYSLLTTGTFEFTTMVHHITKGGNR